MTARELERFRAKVAPTDDADACIVWTGSTTNGYGYMRFRGTPQTAHRIAYEHFVGPIGEGLVVDHLCRNRSCVNVRHMELVTNRENILRGESPAAKYARSDRCVNGHEWSPENTGIYKGARRCRSCARERMARLASARRAA